MKQTCPDCGKEHTEWPAIAFAAPYHYSCLSPEEKATIAELSSDFCVIHHEDQTDRFIRAVLIQKVADHCEPLHYGIWVSLSEKSFGDYQTHFDDKTHKAVYFGYLANWIPGYEDTTFLQANVELAPGGDRPRVIPHRSQVDHPLVADYYNGISKAAAEKKIRMAFEEKEPG